MTSLLPTLAICYAIYSQAPNADLPADYFKPVAVIKVVAENKIGEPVVVPSAFLLHRIDMEKIHVLGSKMKICETQRDQCEIAELERISNPPFFDSYLGKTLLVSGGFAVGVGVTIAILFAVGATN